jgi:uncharacterized protein (DUF433 family)
MMTLRDIINIDPEIMGGTPVFRGTRVPVKTLFDHLEEGDTIEIFLEDFPSVSRKQAKALLELSMASAIQNVLS